MYYIVVSNNSQSLKVRLILFMCWLDFSVVLLAEHIFLRFYCVQVSTLGLELGLTIQPLFHSQSEIITAYNEMMNELLRQNLFPDSSSSGIGVSCGLCEQLRVWSITQLNDQNPMTNIIHQMRLQVQPQASTINKLLTLAAHCEKVPLFMSSPPKQSHRSLATNAKQHLNMLTNTQSIRCLKIMPLQ